MGVNCFCHGQGTVQDTIQNAIPYKQTSVLEQVTITGTRTNKRQTQNPVMVRVMGSKQLENVQACSLADGLGFQTGLRVEMNCQTCNYSQLRMNGLAGGYSQILINGRAIFSPLTGLYGLEQIPANMIDRVEIVKGGGSALYGSSAIGGTLNILTKTPKSNRYQVSSTYQNIKNAHDFVLNGNATLVNENKNAGVSFFVNNRRRTMYDANGDNFSELPQIKNDAFGLSAFYEPTVFQDIRFNFNKLNEYRYGGEMVQKQPHFAKQSEERVHDIYVANADYKIDFNQQKSSFSSYIASQYTGRKHYTGIIPDEQDLLKTHYKNPPYGNSTTTTFQMGAQLNHTIENFLKGIATLTLGAEYAQDNVFDQIKTYGYKINQKTKNTGFFLQNDWAFNNRITLLTGVRLDKHNMLKNFIASPRVSFLYKPFKNTQLRATWGMGFRAPQAFDSDLHIAFAGGGVSRIALAKDLQQERSNSFNVSINYDSPTEHYIYGYTIETFYTYLEDAFYLKPLGEDAHGQRFEKNNGTGASVRGIAIETRLNYDGIFQLESGLTYQQSRYENAVTHATDLEPQKDFLRTPNLYGYATLNLNFSKNFRTNFNYVYTGAMLILHMGGAEGVAQNSYLHSKPFSELGFKSTYIFEMESLATNFSLSAGIKNIFDNYQNDFDIGKNRDSNFIYGPALPRTFFINFKVSGL